MVNLNNTDLVEGTTLTLRFHNGIVRGSSGCNTFNGKYKVEKESIRIDSLVLTTDNCMKPEIMDQERAFTKYLREVHSFAVAEKELTIWMEDGSLVQFKSLIE